MRSIRRFSLGSVRAGGRASRSADCPRQRRVLVVDDHGLVRHGLALAIQARDGSIQVIEAATLAAALEVLRFGPRVELVLYDLVLPDGGGIGGLRAVLASAGRIPVLVVSGCLDGGIVADCVRAGARGVLPKSGSVTALDHAIPLVLGGGVYAPQTGPDTVDRGGRPSALTERQEAVLRLLMSGQSNKEIARELGVLEGTIKVHLRAIMQKLNVRNRTQLALTAARSGIAAR